MLYSGKMNSFKQAFLAATFILFFCVHSVCGQGVGESQEIKVIGKLIDDGAGGKLHVAKFEIIKNFSRLRLLDTISVRYYSYKKVLSRNDFYVLTLLEYSSKFESDPYFIFPQHDVSLVVEKVSVNFIDFKYWENCETGKGDCNSLVFERPKSNEKWFLRMPCGGTQTSISINGPNYKEELEMDVGGCPPLLNMSNFKDGGYSAHMMACGLGGSIGFRLVSKK